MAANLFGERFAGRREPAWHKLGTVFDGPTTASQAAALAGLDYRVAVRALAVEIETGLLDVPDHFAVVRDPTPDDPTHRIFGTCGRDFLPIQNTTLAEILDPLSERWPVETAGALGRGERVFLTLDAGEHVFAGIEGEDLRLYFLLTDSKIPGGGITFLFSPVRVVCQNTLNAAFDEATVRVDLRHTDGIVGRLESIVKLTARLEESRRASLTALEPLATARVVADQVATILRAAYPDPVEPGAVKLARKAGLEHLAQGDRWIVDRGLEHRREVERASEYRAETLALYDRICDESPRIGGTAWAALQAVVEHEDYRPGRGNRALSTLFGEGSRAKGRALAACLKTLK